jgi:F0F1-type ATP synthase membrane subunit b/b'
MESTLNDLGRLLLKAIPTLVLLLIVHLYLKWMFFRPLSKVLAQRRASTMGLREAAEASLKKASELAVSIEAQLRQAREQIYQEQDEARRRWASEQAARLEEARIKARELVHQSKGQLQAEAEAAKRELAASTDALAELIARSLLERTAV